MPHTIETLSMSHYCAAATTEDHIARWDADVTVSHTGYMAESVACPACGSYVATQTAFADED